jgi:hypothetical protein
VERNFFLFRLSSAERELRLDLPSQGRHQLGAPQMLFASRIVVSSAARTWSPTKHLLGLNRVGQSPARARPHRTFRCGDQTPSHGPETLGSQPRGYPFKLKAAPASPAVAGLACGSSFLRTCLWGGCSKIHKGASLFWSDPVRPPGCLRSGLKINGPGPWSGVRHRTQFCF